MVWIGGLVVLLLVAALAWGPVVSSRVEQPKYRVVQAVGDIEIRDYEPMIVAEVEVSGDRRTAIEAGFRTIAGYIFGNNAGARKVAMTAPVTQQAGEKIAMTAPVTQEGEGTDWRVRFIMPSRYTLDTLPKPNDPAVALKALAPKRFAVIRFSGGSDADNLAHHQAMLEDFLRAQNLRPVAGATYAFYNPPWTLPILRRNEVLIEIAR